MRVEAVSYDSEDRELGAVADVTLPTPARRSGHPDTWDAYDDDGEVLFLKVTRDGVEVDEDTLSRREREALEDSAMEQAKRDAEDRHFDALEWQAEARREAREEWDR